MPYRAGGAHASRGGLSPYSGFLPLIFKDYSPIVGAGEELLFDLGVPAAAVQHGRVALWRNTRRSGCCYRSSPHVTQRVNEGYIYYDGV